MRTSGGRPVKKALLAVAQSLILANLCSPDLAVQTQDAMRRGDGVGRLLALLTENPSKQHAKAFFLTKPLGAKPADSVIPSLLRLVLLFNSPSVDGDKTIHRLGADNGCAGKSTTFIHCFSYTGNWFGRASEGKLEHAASRRPPTLASSGMISCCGRPTGPRKPIKMRPKISSFDTNDI